MFSWQLQSIKNVYFLFSSFSSLGTWNKGLKVDPTISFRLSYMFIIPSLNFSTDECTIDQISNKVKDRSSGKDHGPSTKALVVFGHVSNPQRYNESQTSTSQCVGNTKHGSSIIWCQIPWWTPMSSTEWSIEKESNTMLYSTSLDTDILTLVL